MVGFFYSIKQRTEIYLRSTPHINTIFDYFQAMAIFFTLITLSPILFWSCWTCSNPGALLATSLGDGTVRIWDLEEQALCVMGLGRHNGPINRVAFSRDLKYLLTASYDKTIKVWDLEAGKLFKNMDGHSGSVLDLDVLADSTLIASGDENKNIKIWSAKDFSLIRTIVASSSVGALIFSPDGKTLISGLGDGSIEVFDVATGSKLSGVKCHSKSIMKLVLAPDNKYVFTASSDNTAKMLELTTLNVVKTYEGHSNAVLGVAINPQGTVLATSSADSSIILWDVALGSKTKTLTNYFKVMSVQFISDGKVLLSGNFDGQVKQWDALNGVNLRNSIFAASVTDIKFSEFSILPSDLLAQGIICSCGNQLKIPSSMAKECTQININGCFNKETLICEQCDTTCGTCSAPGSKNCLTCSSSKSTKYHESPIKNTDGSCISNCVEPNPFADEISNRCFRECPENRWGSPSTGKCENTCPFGYYPEPASKLCTKCQVPCATCSGPNSNNCRSCFEKSELPFLDTPTIEVDGNCVSNCPIEWPFADQSTGRCYLKCPSPLWGDSSLKKCVSVCPSGSYPSTDSRACTPCDSSCETCSDGGDLKCLSCKAASPQPYHESPVACIDGKCLSVCASPNPFADDATGRCQSTCPSPQYGLLAKNKCVSDCPPNYFINQDKKNCEECDASCETCSAAGAKMCRTCNSLKAAKYLDNPVKDSDGSCVASCLDPYPYADEINLRCYKICPDDRWGLAITGKCEKPCPPGYYPESSSKLCLKCDPSCATCSGPNPNNCKTCLENSENPFLDTPTSGVDGNCGSKCPNDYPFADQSTGRCYLKCPSPRWGDSSQKKCIALCPSASYPNSERRICTSCDPSCETCSDGGNLKCLTCKTASPQPYHESPVACIDGKCLSACASPNPFADDETSRCHSVCPSPKYGLLAKFKCVLDCPANYFINLDKRICEECDASCETCSAAGPKMCRTCNSLKPNKYLDNPIEDSVGSCVISCIDPYPYADELKKRCYKICPNDLWGSSISGKCESVCSPGYYPDPSQKSCQKCHTNCATCSGPNANNCRSCLENSENPFLDTPSLGVDGNCGSSCPKDYPFGDQSTGRCYLKCPSPLWGDISLKKCVSVCSSGSYPSTDSRACTPCDSSCETCSDGGNLKCLSCKAVSPQPYHESPVACIDGKCLSVCASQNPFADDETSRCHSVCPSPKYGLLAKSKCVLDCPTNYFINLDKRICEECDASCETCSAAGAKKCRTCNSLKAAKYLDNPVKDSDGSCVASCLDPYPYADELNLRCYKVCPDDRWGLAITGKCEKPCPPEYYPESSSKLCLKCDSSCATCSGPNPNNCKTCLENSANPFLDTPTLGVDGNCGSKCPNEYPFADQSTGRCYLKCPSPLWGDSSLKKCISVCPSGSYPSTDSRICTSCDPSCETCSDGGNLKCLTCKTASPQPYHESPVACIDGKCLSACPSPNPFADDETSRCHSVCPSPKYGLLAKFKCVLDCPANYFINLDKRICEECDASCETCSAAGPKMCRTCNSLKPNKYLDNPIEDSVGSCVISCIDPYPYADELKKRCYKICPNDRWGSLTTGKCESVCSPGYYPDPSQKSCQKCHTNCAKCSGPNANNCRSCLENSENPFLDAPSLGVDGNCGSSCPKDYPFSDQSTGRCYLKCPSPRWGDSSLKKCVSVCPSGSYPSTDSRICTSCDPSCETCSDGGNLKCLTCKIASPQPYHESPVACIDGKCLSVCASPNPFADDETSRCHSVCPSPKYGLLAKFKCVLDCPTNYFINLDKRICEECDASCETCSAAGAKKCRTCNSLKAAKYLDNPVKDSDSSCVAKCLDPYPYADEINLRCYKICPDDRWGLAITGKCEKPCPPGYYPESSSKLCLKCDPSCATCSGPNPNNCKTCLENSANPFLDTPTSGVDGNCGSKCPNEYPFADQSTGRCYLKCPSPLWGDSSQKKCISLCPPASYPNSETRICTTCDSTCETCSEGGNLKCLSCKVASPLPYHESPIAGIDGKCLSACAGPNPFADDDAGRCQGACSSTKYVILSKKKCVSVCPKNHFVSQDNKNCEECDTSCETCSAAGAKMCRTCNSSKAAKFLNNPVINSDGSCVSDCLDPYPFADELSKRCYKICPDDRWGLESTGKCENTCPLGYYSDPLLKLCKKCHANCASCSGPSSNNCRTCFENGANPFLDTPDAGVDGNCVLNCPINYPFSDKTTGHCYSKCPLPRWGDSSLKKCISSCPYIPECFSCNSSSCKMCKNGYYLESSSRSPSADDIVCVKNCDESSEKLIKNSTRSSDGSGRCEYCKEGLYFSNISNKCENTTSCQISFCQKCLNSTDCLACQAGYFKEKLTKACLDSCPVGFYKNNSECAPCKSGCISCTASPPNYTEICLKCEPRLLLRSSDQSCIESCGANKYYKIRTETEGFCEACHSSCATCFGSGERECLTCPDNHTLKGTLCQKQCGQEEGNFTTELAKVNMKLIETVDSLYISFSKEVYVHQSLNISKLFDVTVGSLSRDLYNYSIERNGDDKTSLELKINFKKSVRSPQISVAMNNMSHNYLRDGNQCPVVIDYNSSEPNITYKTVYVSANLLNDNESSGYVSSSSSVGSFIVISNGISYFFNLDRLSSLWLAIDSIQSISLLLLLDATFPKLLQDFLLSTYSSHASFVIFLGKSFNNSRVYNFGAPVIQKTYNNNVFLFLGTASFMANGLVAFAIIGVLYFLLFGVKIIILYCERKGKRKTNLDKHVDLVNLILRNWALRASTFFLPIIVLSACVQLKYYGNPSGAGSFISILALIYYAVFILYCAKFIINKKDIYSNDPCSNYNPLFEGISVNSIWTRNHYLFVLVRKFLFSVLVAALSNVPTKGYIALLVLYLLSVAKNIVKNPFLNSKIRYITLASEGLVAVTLIIFLLLSQNNDSMLEGSMLVDDKAVTLQLTYSRVIIGLVFVNLAIFFCVSLVLFCTIVHQNMDCLCVLVKSMGLFGYTAPQKEEEEDLKSSRPLDSNKIIVEFFVPTKGGNQED